MMHMCYQGREISKEEINNSKDGEYSHLGVRLGYIDERDFGINGFSYIFNIKELEPYYYDQLTSSPEIFRDLENFLKIDLTTDFALKSKKYIHMLSIPLSQITLGYGYSYSVVSNEKKELEYLVKCLKTLTDYYVYGYSRNNPLLVYEKSKGLNISKTLYV